MINVAKGLANAGFRVTIVLSAREGELIDEVPENVSLIAAHSRYKMTSTADYKPLLNVFREIKPDVIVANNNRATLFCGRMKLKGQINAPVIMWSHSPVSMESAVPPWKPVHWLPQLYRRYTVKVAAAVMLSHAMKQDFEESIPALKDRLCVIYNPILPEDLEDRKNLPSTHPWLKEKTTPVIVTVGRLTAEKDHENLIRAFSKIGDSNSSRLIIFGEGPARAELESVVASLNLQERVSLPGSVANPYAELSRADLFVLSSKYEGLPGALVEAMASGLPVVSTNPAFSGVAEILLDGQLGQMVRPQNSDELAKAMTHGLENGQKSELKSLERFTARQTISSWIQLIQEVMPQGQPRGEG